MPFGRGNKKQARTNGGVRPNRTAVKKKDRAQTWLSWLDNMLDLDHKKRENCKANRMMAELKPEFKKSFEKWKQYKMMNQQYNIANIALFAYYQPGKIQDLLKKLEAFSKNIRDDKKPEIIALKGYENYIVFIKSNIEKMRDRHEELVKEGAPEKIETTQENVCWFLEEECGAIPWLQKVSKYRRMTEELAKASEKSIGTGAYDNNYGELDTFFEEIKQEELVSYIKEELNQLTENLEKRREILEKKCKLGEELYDVLCERFPDSWFDCLDPEREENGINTKTAQELKQLYENIMEPIRKNILERFMNAEEIN